jgi:glycosyltransferase involved in cell wall biosynthesis
VKPNLFISAIYISPPGTMGGNTKILIEAINYLSHDFDVVVFTTEPGTLTAGLVAETACHIEEIPYPFEKMSFGSHLHELRYLQRWYSEYFSKRELSKSDIFYSASDFAPDVVPIFWLRRRYDFQWFPSLFLFIPNPWENVRNRYRFPFLKYSIYFVYQRLLLGLMKARATGIILTNKTDFTNFKKRHSPRLFAIYGGVNLEEIDEAKHKSKAANGGYEYDAVFCGRLHEQKGIDGFLDIWKLVVDELPLARLGVIGNGAPKFENYLRAKASENCLEENVVWRGYVNGPEKYSIYLKSRLFVHPTIYDNNGMVAAEALCSGMPVIMFDLPNLRDLYDSGCLKVPRFDKAEFARSIISVLTDSRVRHTLELSSDQLRSLRLEWSWESRMQQLASFLDPR